MRSCQCAQQESQDSLEDSVVDLDDCIQADSDHQTATILYRTYPKPSQPVVPDPKPADPGHVRLDNLLSLPPVLGH